VAGRLTAVLLDISIEAEAMRLDIPTEG